VSRAVYCSVCGRPTHGMTVPEGYRIRVHRRADKPKEPLALCSGWQAYDHVPILLAREQALAAAMDEEEDIRVGTPGEDSIAAAEVHACLGESPSGSYVLVRFAGPTRAAPEDTSECSVVVSVAHLSGIIAQLQRIQDHLARGNN
jgi:hypothetical protein